MRYLRSHLRPLLLVAALLPHIALAERLPGHVLRIVDGDTLILKVQQAHYRVDIAGIDAPELNQPWGARAAQRLDRLLRGAFVVVAAERIDGTRLSGRITHQTRDVGLGLLIDGLAWQTRFPPRSADPQHPYVRAEQRARRERRGLWSAPDAVAPWLWRRTRAPLR